MKRLILLGVLLAVLALPAIYRPTRVHAQAIPPGCKFAGTQYDTFGSCIITQTCAWCPPGNVAVCDTTIACPNDSWFNDYGWEVEDPPPNWMLN